MARPMKAGIEYFPFDVGFLRDKKVKLLRSEFGSKGILILLHLLCSIYETDGYYMSWDDDDRFLVSETLGCGCTPELVEQVVQGCLKRSLFDERVFQVFGALTSAGIQKRYIRARRGKIYLRTELFLLDLDNEDDVPDSIRRRILFLHTKNGINDNNNPVCDNENPSKCTLKKSKVKKIKEKENKENKTAPQIDPDFGDVISFFESCGFKINGYTSEELSNLIDEYSKEWVMKAIRRAADMNKMTIGYVKGILGNWQTSGGVDTQKQEIDWNDV